MGFVPGAHLVTFSDKKEDGLCLSSMYSLKLGPKSMRDTISDSHEPKKENYASAEVDNP